MGGSARAMALNDPIETATPARGDAVSQLGSPVPGPSPLARWGAAAADSGGRKDVWSEDRQQAIKDELYMKAGELGVDLEEDPRVFLRHRANIMGKPVSWDIVAGPRKKPVGWLSHSVQ